MRSLRMKMVMIMVILILALMLTTGAFLMSGVGNFYVSQFYEQMEGTFTPEFIAQLQRLSAEDNAPAQMKELLMAQAGLGIDITGRNVYILDQTGSVLDSSNQRTTVVMTQNILSAMNGEVGQEGSITSSYMDLAVPIVSTNGTYIVYILDSRATVDALTGELFSIILSALGLGLVILYSASAYNGRVRFHDPAYYFKKQLFASALGVIGMYAVAKIDYRRLFALAPWFYAASLALSTAVLFFGSEYNGSKRWLKLGPLSFQPSEFAKMAVILFLPWVMEHTKGRSDSLWFMTKAVLCTLPIAALVGSNNLSTAIILLGICAFLIFISHPGYLPFLGIGGAGIGFIAVFLMMESYRLERLAIWRDPEKYEKGFQTIQGLYAIGSGGIFGRGMGNSLQRRMI